MQQDKMKSIDCMHHYKTAWFIKGKKKKNNKLRSLTQTETDYLIAWHTCLFLFAKQTSAPYLCHYVLLRKQEKQSCTTYCNTMFRTCPALMFCMQIYFARQKGLSLFSKPNPDTDFSDWDVRAHGKWQDHLEDRKKAETKMLVNYK